MSGKRKAADAGVGFFSTLFERVKKGGKDGAKALKELEKGISTRAGGKKAQGVEIIKGTKTRDLGKGFGLRQTGVDKSGKKVGSRMANEKELGQRSAVIRSGRKRIGAGAAGAAGTAYILSGDDKAAGKDKGKADKNKAGTTTAKKKTTTAKKDDGKKTFRERRLARMKKRLEGSENEGRKRRLKRRIGRVEGRIEDSKKKPKKMMGGGEAQGPRDRGITTVVRRMAGGEARGPRDRGIRTGTAGRYYQGGEARLDESLGERRGKESTKSQSMKSRRNESRGARKPSKPQSAGAATRGWGAAIR